MRLSLIGMPPLWLHRGYITDVFAIGIINMVRTEAMILREERSLTFAPGPIVRVAPNTLSFDSHQSYLDIYGRKANNRKLETYNALSASRGKQNVLSVVDKGIAAFKRRVYQQVFSTQGMKNVEGRLLSHFEAFTSLLSQTTPKENTKEGNGWGTPINMAERCIWLTHDVITELCFSKSSDMQSSPELRHFPTTTRFMSFRGYLVGRNRQTADVLNTRS